MNSTIIMYHYVQDPKNGMKGMSPQDFLRQVQHLKSIYKIVSLEEALSASPPTPNCILTFDDGLKDSFTTIFPILQSEGVTGCFYVSTAVLERPTLLHVQKRHLLLAKVPVPILIDDLNRNLPERFQIVPQPQARDEYLDGEPIASMKWCLDHFPREIMDEALDRVFVRHVGRVEDLWHKVYLSAEEIQTMATGGMEFGSHGHTHTPLATLSEDQQRFEFNQSIRILEQTLGHRPRSLSYPSGSYDTTTLNLMNEFDLACGLTVHNRRNDPSTSRYELNRVDCIHVHRLPLPDRDPNLPA